MKSKIILVGIYLLLPFHILSMNELVSETVLPTIEPTIILPTLQNFSLPPSMFGKQNLIFLVDVDDSVMSRHALLCYFSLEDRVKFFQTLIERGQLENSPESLLPLALHIDKTDNPLSPYYVEANELVESTIGWFLQYFKSQGAIILGYTARAFEIADITRRELSAFNIDFAALSGFNDVTITNDNSKVGFKDGIWYTGNTKNKVLFLPDIVEMVKKHGRAQEHYLIVHLDDSKKEIGAYSLIDATTIAMKDRVTIQPILYTHHSIKLQTTMLDTETFYNRIYRELFSILGISSNNSI